MQFYLAAGMGDTLPRGRFRPVRAAYRLGPRLLSAIGGGAVQGGMMLVGDSRECGPHDVLARDIIRECLRRNYDGVVLDWYHKGPDRGTLTALLGQLCPQYGLRLFVPEQYAPYAAQATVLRNPAVSGGPLAACLEDGIRRYGAGRLALDLERLRLDFTLPHSANVRRPLTASELRRLREGGLKMVYMGLESGCDAVLERMQKGHTAAAIVAAGQKARRAGLALSVTAISGLGSRELLREHAVDTARALSAMNPEYIGLLTLMVEPGTPLERWVREGSFQVLGPAEILQETALLLDHMDSPGSVFRMNHASNYLTLKGTLNRDLPALRQQVQEGLMGHGLRPESWRAL